MKSQSTTKGFAILSAAGLICKILSLVYVPIQTAIVHDYGNNIINFGYRIYVFAFSFSNAGLPSSISKMVSEQLSVGNAKGSKKIFKIATITLIALSLIIAVLLASCANWIAIKTKQREAAVMLLTLSPVFIFTGINCALRGYFQGRSNMVPTAISQIIEQLFNSICTVVFIYLFFNYTGHTLSQKNSNAAAGSALGTIAGAVVATVFLIFMYLRTKRQRDYEEKNLIYEGSQLKSGEILLQIVKYSIPALIGSIAASAADMIDATNCIRRMTYGGISEVVAKNINGQYTTAFQRTLSISTFVATALMVALIPAISKACSLKDKKMLKHNIENSFRALFIFMIPSLVGFSVLAKPIISFIFFNTNQGGAQFLSIWGWTNILIGIITLQSGILIGLSKPFAAPLNLILGMFIKFFINYFLISIPALNMHGAAIGSAVGWIITVVLNNYFIEKGSGLDIRYHALFLRPLAFSTAIGIFSIITFNFIRFVSGITIHSRLFVNDMSLIITIILCGIIYSFLLTRSKTLKESDVLNLPMGKRLAILLKKIKFI